MRAYPLRCKHCAGVLESPGLWGRLVSGDVLHCPVCSKTTPRRDAVAMGVAFGSWLDELLSKLRQSTHDLIPLTHHEAAERMGVKLVDCLREMSSLQMLCDYIAHMFKPVLLSQAHGEAAGVEVHAVGGESNGVVGACGVLGVIGRIGQEETVREWEAMIARVGPAQFVVYAPAASNGILSEAMRHVGRAGAASGEGPASPPRPVPGALVPT